MDFPLIDLMDRHACYQELVGLLHPDGLACPRCGASDRMGIHRRHRDPLIDYQCGHCRRVFNAFTGTPLQGIRRSPAELLVIARGVAQAAPTAELARELGCDRKHLLELRHRLQGNALLRLDRNPLDDAVVEAERRTSTRGKKGIPHPDPADPPRRRANRRRGHGTFANDRPPVAGVVGRDSGEVRLEVIGSASGAELEDIVDGTCLEGTTVNTDEWKGYSRVDRRHHRIHRAVDHSGPKGTWALDPDGDGVREVHCNTQEGLWTGLRIFLGRFRGVSKWYLAQYVAMFQWAHNLKRATDNFLRALLGMWPSTGSAS